MSRETPYSNRPRLTDPLAIDVGETLVDDGRNINQGLGTLSGEAAGQQPLRTKHDPALHAWAYSHIPSQQPGEPGYYDQPMLKQPTWIWSIPTYFYVGGVAGVSGALGAAAQVFAGGSMDGLIVKTRWIATVGGAISAGLLIHDLGRPARFLNMLRVFRPTSPMNMGSWILTTFSTATGGAAVLPFGPRLFRPLAWPLGLIGGILGLGLSGYTGVLISQTAVPVWQESYRTMPVMFLASGTAASAAFLDFFELAPAESRTVERFGLMGKIIELLSALVLERDANRVKRVGEPLKKGFGGFLWQSAKVFTAMGIVLSLMPGKGRKKKIANGVLGTAGSLCLRFGIFFAGKRSARDARASFAQQREQPPELAAGSGR